MKKLHPALAWVFTVTVGAVALATAGEAAPPIPDSGEAGRPDRVLLVLIDALRPDMLGAFGYPRGTSPNFDRLASQGVLFEECRSTSTWTKPALASLFSGVGPIVHGVEKGGMSDSHARLVPALSSSFETLAELFRRHDFTTVTFTGNPHLAEETGLAQGFDRLSRTAQFGPGLAEDVVEWLEMPLLPSADVVATLARNPGNLLRGDAAAIAGQAGELEVSASEGRIRVAPRPPLAGRRCGNILLAEVPSGEQGFVFGMRYLPSIGTSVAVTAPGGELHRSAHFSAQQAVEQVVIERLPASAGPISLELCFVHPEARIELWEPFVVPAEALDGLREDRWFVYLHLMNSHLPFRASPAQLEGFPPSSYGSSEQPLSDRARRSLGRQTIPRTDDFRVYRSHYDASIHEADAMLGEVVAALDRLGILEGTLIVVTADHGEELLDHGEMNHGGAPYEELLRIPLLFYYPAGFASGRRVSGPVSLLDVYPTLAELLGLAPAGPITGRSLAPYLRDARSAVEARPFFTTFTPMWKGAKLRIDVLIEGRLKLMVTTGRGDEEQVELYDLAEDPGETVNLAGGREEDVRRLREELESTRAEQERLQRQTQSGPADHMLGETAEEQLRSLGYL